MNELAVFLVCLEHNYKLNLSEYPSISSTDINLFKDRMTSFSNNGIGEDMQYDPKIEPLVQSSLAHFLYMKKIGIYFEGYENGDNLPEKMPFHPNYIIFKYMDGLNKSVRLDYFKLYELSPSTTSMNWDKLMQKVNALLENPILRVLVCSFFKKLQVGGDTLDRIIGFIQNKTKPTRGLGLLYFILMDLYLEHVDKYIYDSIKKSGLNCCSWDRCLNTAILGFADMRTAQKYNKILLLDSALAAWGLTAKVRAGTKGGRVLRPWRGKLYINMEGHIQWERPESIIDM